MAEFTNVAAQTVAANGNVAFSNTAVKGSNCIQHREGSGIITLRGLTNQCKARFFVDFSGNIAIPTGGTVGAISLAIAISGSFFSDDFHTGGSRSVQQCILWYLY